MRCFLAIVVASALCGCVSRRLTIRTDPPGALVELDGEPIGFSPVSTDFDYYATREVTISKAGYETLTILQPIKPPWYQVPPLDFVSDNFLIGKHVTDRHEVSYTLQRQKLEPGSSLLDRAQQVRSSARGG